MDTYSEGRFSITVGKKKYTDKKNAGVALMAEATAKATEDGYTTIGKFAGFELRVVKTHEGIKGLMVGRQGYNFNTYPGNTTYMVNHLISIVEGMSGSVELWEQNLAETRKDLAEQEKLVAVPFAKQEELDRKRARYNEVMSILNPKEEQSLDSIDEGTEQNQSRAYLAENKYPTTAREWSAFNRSFANKTTALKDGETKRIMIITADNVYFVEANGYMSGEVMRKIAIDGNVDTIKAFEKEFLHGTDESTETFDTLAKGYEVQHGRSDWDHVATGYAGVSGRNDELDDAASGSNAFGSYWESLGYNSFEELIEAVNSGAMVMDDAGNLVKGDQHQQRTDTLTDRELLDMAAGELAGAVDLTDGERDALRIFRERLEKLRQIQEKRQELGTLV